MYQLSLAARPRGPCRLPSLPQTRAAKPNVLIVVTDDQGMGDFSYTGNPVLKTPGFDRFAAEAVRFTDFHVTPMCTPTRGQLLTGVDALRNGATSVTAGRSFLRPGIPTAAGDVRGRGVQDGAVRQVAPRRPLPAPAERPRVSRRRRTTSASACATRRRSSTTRSSTAGTSTTAGPKRFTGHCTDHWFDSATAWMKERHEKGEPFFCYLPTNAPHGPHVERPEFVKPYQGKGPAAFFGMIAHVDQRFGQLDEFLTSSGLRDNTLVIFMTDNGGTAGVNVHNAGLRGRKTTYYDGGHRVAVLGALAGGKPRPAARRRRPGAGPGPAPDAAGALRRAEGRGGEVRRRQPRRAAARDAAGAARAQVRRAVQPGPGGQVGRVRRVGQVAARAREGTVRRAGRPGAGDGRGGAAPGRGEGDARPLRGVVGRHRAEGERVRADGLPRVRAPSRWWN